MRTHDLKLSTLGMILVVLVEVATWLCFVVGNGSCEIAECMKMRLVKMMVMVGMLAVAAAVCQQ